MIDNKLGNNPTILSARLTSINIKCKSSVGISIHEIESVLCIFNYICCLESINHNNS